VQLEFPEFWDSALPLDKVHVVPVNKESAEWKDVMKETKGCMNGRVSFAVLLHDLSFTCMSDEEQTRALQVVGMSFLQVTCIERIQNAELWASYKKHRDYLTSMKYDAAKFKLNDKIPGGLPALERRMWHGTKGISPENIYKTAAGWCASYAAVHGSCGRGSYFAWTPEYSMRGYAFAGPHGSQLLLADVLVGEFFPWTACSRCM
jgi:hypothetical protein